MADSKKRSGGSGRRKPADITAPSDETTTVDETTSIDTLAEPFAPPSDVASTTPVGPGDASGTAAAIAAEPMLTPPAEPVAPEPPPAPPKSIEERIAELELELELLRAELPPVELPPVEPPTREEERARGARLRRLERHPHARFIVDDACPITGRELDTGDRAAPDSEPVMVSGGDVGLGPRHGRGVVAKIAAKIIATGASAAELERAAEWIRTRDEFAARDSE